MQRRPRSLRRELSRGLDLNRTKGRQSRLTSFSLPRRVELTDKLIPIQLMTLRRIARRTRIEFLLLGRLPKPSIGIEDFGTEFGEQFLEDSSSVDSSFVLTKRVLEGDLDGVLQTGSDGVEVGVTVRGERKREREG